MMTKDSVRVSLAGHHDLVCTNATPLLPLPFHPRHTRLGGQWSMAPREVIPNGHRRLGGEEDVGDR
jgi:hypothetical protein